LCTEPLPSSTNLFTQRPWETLLVNPPGSPNWGVKRAQERERLSEMIWRGRRGKREMAMGERRMCQPLKYVPSKTTNKMISFHYLLKMT
jgi:DNA mismatch repair protein MutH